MAKLEGDTFLFKRFVLITFIFGVYVGPNRAGKSLGLKKVLGV